MGDHREVGRLVGELIRSRGTPSLSSTVFGPTTSLTSGAATPPADGFFDAAATYMGAFKDASDNWATKGKWAVWSDK